MAEELHAAALCGREGGGRGCACEGVQRVHNTHLCKCGRASFNTLCTAVKKLGDMRIRNGALIASEDNNAEISK